jgi:response regulator RpfG family c-di-GMP phosphodiesterase
LRLLLVDDDQGFRALLRETLEAVDIDVAEAEDARGASAAIDRDRPDVVVLDVRMPGRDGIELCRELKAAPRTRGIGVILLTGGGEDGYSAQAAEAGADAFLLKPFSPLQLLAVVENVAGVPNGIPFRAAAQGGEEQLLLYARDLRRLLEIERGQRQLLQSAYHETVEALANALESKDTGTRAHSQRVQRYALELASAVDPELLADPAIEYGFLLHDVGKIGIPDRILRKPGPLTTPERRLMETHTVLGEAVLSSVAFLQGAGVRVVRSHHERWDGTGYPDGRGGDEIPLAARIFAVADALDAMTSDRPYRRALPWERASAEIAAQSGRQFDPDIVAAFREREPSLRTIHARLAAA